MSWEWGLFLRKNDRSIFDGGLCTIDKRLQVIVYAEVYSKINANHNFFVPDETNPATPLFERGASEVRDVDISLRRLYIQS